MLARALSSAGTKEETESSANGNAPVVRVIGTTSSTGLSLVGATTTSPSRTERAKTGKTPTSLPVSPFTSSEIFLGVGSSSARRESSGRSTERSVMLTLALSSTGTKEEIESSANGNAPVVRAIGAASGTGLSLAGATTSSPSRAGRAKTGKTPTSPPVSPLASCEIFPGVRFASARRASSGRSTERSAMFARALSSTGTKEEIGSSANGNAPVVRVIGAASGTGLSLAGATTSSPSRTERAKTGEAPTSLPVSPLASCEIFLGVGFASARRASSGRSTERSMMFALALSSTGTKEEIGSSANGNAPDVRAIGAASGADLSLAGATIASSPDRERSWEKTVPTSSARMGLDGSLLSEPASWEIWKSPANSGDSSGLAWSGAVSPRRMRVKAAR